MLLEEMTFAEVKEYFANGNEMAIIPCGSTEQHGHHLVLGTDSFLAETFAKRLSEKTGILCVPTVSYGYAEYHKEGYSGTIGFDQDLLYTIYYSIAEQLVQMGAKKIIFVNGHGGNSYPLKRVSMNLRLHHRVMGLIIDWWSVAEQLNPAWKETGHAGKEETSAMLYLYPQYVHPERIRFEGYRALSDTVETLGSATFSYAGIAYHIWLNTSDVVPNGGGNYGEDPHLATVQQGKESVEAVIAHLAEFLQYGFGTMQLPSVQQ